VLEFVVACSLSSQNFGRDGTASAHEHEYEHHQATAPFHLRWDSQDTFNVL
jgi:hypothetical protein